MRKLLLLLVCFTCLCAFSIERQSNSDYRARRVKLAEKSDGGVVILFASMEKEGPNAVFGFRQSSDFYYLTGWAEPGAALLIAPAGAGPNGTQHPYTEIFFLPEHNVSQEKWTGPKLGPENPDAPRATGFDRVGAIDSMHAELLKLLPQPRARVLSDLAADSDSAAPIEWLRRANSFPNYIGMADVKPLIAALRMAKDKGEIERIRKATDASVAAHLAALKAIRNNVTEREIAALMEYEYNRRGCERPAYSPIVGSGFYSTVLHYSADAGTMHDGDVVVMDVAGEYSMYTSDITRTAPINGHFSARQREIYDIVLGAQKAAMDAFVAGKSRLSGTAPESLYKVALDYINAHGKDMHGEPLGKYFIHGLGHHVGLDVHDANDASQPLDRNMVFTMEPGIYIPEEKLGVRIEDLYLVGEDGKLIRLTEALPHTADEVERAMAH